MSEVDTQSAITDQHSRGVADRAASYIGLTGVPDSNHGCFDWTIRSIETLVSRVTSGGTPEAGNPRYYTSVAGYPFAKIEDLTRAKGSEVFECEQSITEAALRESSAKLYPSGTILLSMYGTIGLAKQCGRPMTANQALCALVPPFSCDDGFLLYSLDYVRDGWKRFSGQTTQANIGSGIVRRRLLSLPPRQQQEKIAAVLDTLDIAIRQTEAIIAKLKQVKRGLLHDLLTRGIDANGELRLPQSQAPHLYKQSPVGWIPKEWSLELMDNVAVRGSGHTPSKSVRSYWDGGVKWVSLADSHRLDLIYIDETDKQISDLGIANSSAVKHPMGTVILSRDAGIGKSAVLASEMAVSQHFIAWRCGERLNNLFLYFNLQRLKPTFEAIAMGSTIKTIGLPFFKRFEIAIPARDEQDRAVEILLAAERRLKKEEWELAKLLEQKAGLMDDLLTGRVRVTPLLESVTA
jgi:type I restriction enzyme S subunit